ncbi:MAG TPA: T9SS type A sorting domain-containing protein [Bacteroidales bacterium]|nr:T9SS type A sorting domain-containing protein [Bacteroidales bacterium]
MKLFTKLMSMCLIVAISSTFAFSQTSKGSKNPAPNGVFKPVTLKAENSATIGFVNSLNGPKALFDLLFEYPVITTGTAGVETDGQFFYVTRWNANLFYKYNLTGVLVDSFSITGAGNIRDLAYDGQYFYGGSASNIIYKMDFSTNTLVGTITCPAGTVVRHIAYDPVNNGFWCGNWDTDFSLISMTGTLLNTIPATTHLQTDIYGSAYDGYTPGGPYLWLYRQTTTNVNDLAQVTIATGAPTAVTFDVATVVTGLTQDNSAGGLCISNQVVPNTAALIGVAQNGKLWGLELMELSVAANDMGVTTLQSPVSTDTLTNADSIRVLVRNFDSVAHANIPVNYVIDGGAVVRDTLWATLPGNTDMSFTFSQPYDFSIPGHVYDIMIYTSYPADGNTLNDTLSTTVSNMWDVAPVSIDMAPIIGVGATAPLATVQNNSTMPTSFTVTMTITGGYSSTKNVANLNPGATQQVTFDSWTATLGNKTVTVYTTLAADSVPANDTITAIVDVQNLTKVYGYVAYDPDGAALPEGPAYTYLQNPQIVVSLADQSSMNYLTAGAWGPLNKWYGAVSTEFNLVTIDTLTGDRTVVGNIGLNLSGLAYDQTTSTLYGVSYDGSTNTNLYTINPASGAPTLVGTCAATSLINLACTPAGQLYAVSNSDDNLYSIDKTTGTATIVGALGFDVAYAQDMEIDQNTGICYMVAYNNTSGAGEMRIVDLSAGSTTLVGTLMHGMEMTGFAIPFQVAVPANDALVAGIDNLNSSCTLASEDIEIRVTNFGANSITNLPVAYTINNGAAVADVIPGPIASGQTVSFTFAVPADLSADGDYDIAVYTMLTGDVNTANDTLVLTVSNIVPNAVPYTIDFEQTAGLAGTTIVDNNNDQTTWYLSASNGNNGPACIVYSWNTAAAADDWFITSCINLEASKTYNVEYYYKVASATYPENLKVAIGNANDPAALTTVINDHAGIVSTSYVAGNGNFTVPADGIYYLGWQCYSAADMYNLFLDDISITETTGVDENDAAVDMMIMPNPASDQFTVVSSERESVITLTNSIGAVIYRAQANDNTFTVNTAGLTAGIYFVKVETSKGSVVKKLMIAK